MGPINLISEVRNNRIIRIPNNLVSSRLRAFQLFSGHMFDREGYDGDLRLIAVPKNIVHK